MKQQDQFNMDVRGAVKTLRSAIRLKHSLAADAEINDKIPALEDAMTAAAVTGQPYQVDIAQLLAQS